MHSYMAVWMMALILLLLFLGVSAALAGRSSGRDCPGATYHFCSPWPVWRPACFIQAIGDSCQSLVRRDHQRNPDCSAFICLNWDRDRESRHHTRSAMGLLSSRIRGRPGRLGLTVVPIGAGSIVGGLATATEAAGVGAMTPLDCTEGWFHGFCCWRCFMSGQNL